MKNIFLGLPGIQVLAVFLLLFNPAVNFSQNSAAPGMEVQSRNFTSFPAAATSSTAELWRKYNDPSDYDHPEFGTLPAGAPCTECVEDYSRRKVDERYFINTSNPSEFFLQKSLGDLHASVNGELVTLDHRLKPAGEHLFESGFTFEQAGIDASTKRTYIRTVSGVVYFNNWKLFTKTNGVETERGVADWSDYSVGADGMLIRNVFPGIDAEILVLRGALKTNFVIKENVFGTFNELIFRDEFVTPSATGITFEENPEFSEGVGKLVVKSGGQEVLSVGESILFPRNGPKELVQSGSYRLAGNKLDVVVPFTWINDNIGSYELIVDPVVTGTATLAQASITGSRYNGSCDFTNSCDYILSVPRPANATITNAAWTFTYSANGSTCWLQDGAIRIGVGSCISPATAGYYWFCNAIGGGTCAGTNQTIFGDVASCIPAPGCTVQNINFTLKFYRSCWGATGCSNTCIGAAAPWTMTITGNTIDYANVANPITLSATTVCQGGSITASTSASGGVPPYTYNWSFSPTGTPSVGSGASATITFPTAGTVTLYSFVTDACGNTVTSSRTITVTAGPAITVTPSPATICAGASTVLTASGATTYAWTPSAGLSATTGPSVTASPAATTTYTVTGTTAGCTGTTTVIVNVNPIPVITVTPNPAAVCSGNSAVLTATGGTTYSWSPATGLSATTGSTVTANPAATTTYTVTGTTSGCTGSTTVNVSIAPLPVVTVTPSSASVCQGASATLTAAGATTFSWSPATGLSATTGASVTANPTVTTTYTVTGTTGACSSTATVTVTVNPNPVVSVNPAAPTICAGTSTVLNATGAASYAWSPATGLSATTGSSVTANPSATTTYTVTGTTGGCTGSATVIVTVTPLPVVTATPSSATICSGGSVSLAATGATTYAWSPATGLSSATGSPVTASPSSTTLYTVTGTTNGCSSTATANVTVTPNPAVSVSPASPSVCSGGSVVLTATGATTFSWTPVTGLSSSTSATVTANPGTTTTYTVTGTSASCSSTATVTVTVNANPVVAVNSATICAGNSTPLNATGAATFAWSPSTGLSATTGATVTANPAVTTTYTVTGTNPNGCSSTATAVVTVNPAPVLSISPSAPSICSGNSVTLAATGAGTYSWSPATGLSSTTGTPVTASPASTTTYTLTGTQNGCTSTQNVTVTVNPNPVITVNSPSVCEGTSGNLAAFGAATFTWTPSTGLSSTTGSPVTASPASTTTYTVTGTNPNGCSGSATATVTVKPLPVISAANNGPLCPGDQLLLTSNGTAGSTYSWSGPAAFSSAVQNPSIDPVSSSNAGAYTVTATLNGCSAAASTTLVMNPGLSTTINPAGPFCMNDGAQLLTAANPGGVWTGPGVNASTGSFDPSLANNGSNTITYEIPGSCSDVSSVSIIVNPLPVVSFTSDKISGCPPLEVQFTNTSASAGIASWDFGDLSGSSASNPKHEYTAVGCFDVRLSLTDGNGCINQATIADMICLQPNPEAGFIADNYEVSTLYPVFNFLNQSTGASSYSWEFGDGTGSVTVNPTHTYTEEPGSYKVWLFAYNAAGCADSTFRIVKVKDEVVFYIPNAFTPNGDEHNNTFQPVFTSGFDPYSFSMIIFNRWGEIIFESHDAKAGWDGTYNGQMLNEGSYVWTVQFKSRENDEKYHYTGQFILMK